MWLFFSPTAKMSVMIFCLYSGRGEHRTFWSGDSPKYLKKNHNGDTNLFLFCVTCDICKPGDYILLFCSGRFYISQYYFALVDIFNTIVRRYDFVPYTPYNHHSEVCFGGSFMPSGQRFSARKGKASPDGSRRLTLPDFKTAGTWRR